MSWLDLLDKPGNREVLGVPRFLRTFFHSNKTLVALLAMFILGIVSSIIGHRTAIRYETVGLVPFLHEINSWRVAARVAYPSAYFGFLILLVLLLGMTLLVRLGGSLVDAVRMHSRPGREEDAPLVNRGHVPQD